MPDIFNRNAEDYSYRQALTEFQACERYEQANHARFPHATPQHDFNALGAGVPVEFQRASQDQQALGYLTNNLLAIQAAVDEILYTDYRLPSFLAINSNIPEGARSYGVRVTDRRGKAQRVSGPGWEAPSASASQSLVTKELFLYGLDGEWSLDELRGAMMAGIPLDTETVNAAVTGSLEKMEEVGLLGEEGDPGLLTLTTAENGVVITTQPNGQTFQSMTAVQIRNLINGEMSRIIDDSKEAFGRNIRDGMTIYLPGEQYDLLTTKYIGDDAEKTVMRCIREDNPWTHFSGSPIAFERVLELEGRGGSGADRMVVSLKNSRVIEMGVSITPRVIGIMNKGRVYCAQVESKYSTVFVKRGNLIRYTDGI